MEGNGLPQQYGDKTYGTVDPKLLEGLTEQQRSSILSWEAFTQYQMAMAEITGNMKEIPTLPSDIPIEGDRHSIQRVELPGEGGVLTFMEHFEHPYRGFPFLEFVDKIDMMKKLIKGSLSGLYHSFRANKLKILLVFPAVLVFRELLQTGIYTFYRLTERHKIKAHRYSKAIRAFYKAFSEPRKNELVKSMDLRFMLRDVLCMILEFDNAYRFRAQDILVELNKDSLRKNPIKELNRLADLASSRELEQQVKDTWKLLKMFNSFYLRFDRQLKSMIVDVLSQLDLEEFKLMPEDIAFCKPRKDYVFGFTKNVIT